MAMTEQAGATRAVAASLFPELVADKYVGPLPLSVQTGTNADLMWSIRDLYLAGSVLDVTYGDGKWWERFTPDPFTAHDLYKLDGVDFRALPEPDASVDTVCFDPPYVPQGGEGTLSAFRDRFGLQELSVHWSGCYETIRSGLAECARVTRRFVLVKCMEFVSGGEFHDVPGQVRAWARELELGQPWDVIVHASGSGPGGHNIAQPVRCRRAHSTLLVFRKGSRWSETVTPQT